MTAPLPIDVLVSPFHVAATAKRSLRSILDRSVRDIRLIVVDDGSMAGYPLTATDDRTAIRWIEAVWPHVGRARRDHARWLRGTSLGHLLRRRKWRAASVLASPAAHAARLLALVAGMSAHPRAARLCSRPA